MSGNKPSNDNIREVQGIISCYDKFVPHKIIALLGKSGVSEINPGDQIELHLTILFSDIRGFTTISESLSPKETFDFINSYFYQMDKLININNGIIDKYIGDAIMALFPTNADDALKCSLLMLNQLENYNETRKKSGYQEINIGIGLNTGISMLGIIGGINRIEGTVLSDAVNLASRLESLTKEYDVRLLISENTLYNLKDSGRYSIRFIDRVMVKGKKQPQSVFEVFDNDADEIKKHKLSDKIIFEEGIANYHYKNIKTAKELFEKCLEKNQNDMPALKYLERCNLFLEKGIHKAASELSQQVEWTEKNNIGIKIIDKQHYELFDKSKKLLTSVKNQENDIEEIMNFLEDYAQKHFSTEEKYMQEYNYPFIKHQIDQHQKYVKTFSVLKKEVVENRLAKTYLMFRIQIFLIDWLVNHTMKEDMHFGRFLKYQKKSA